MDSDDNTNDNINDTNDNNDTDNYGILNNFELVWILLNYLMGTNIYFNLGNHNNNNNNISNIDKLLDFNNTDNCLICENVFNIFKVLPCCKKTMCVKCITVWFDKSNSCPFCRRDVNLFI